MAIKNTPMKEFFSLALFVLFTSVFYGQTTLHDPNLKTTVEKIKDNRDQLFKTFKGGKEPDLGLGLGESYYTKIKIYGVKGSLTENNFDEDMSFRISTNELKKATKADFENAFTELSGILKSVFSDLELREKQNEQSKEIVLFEKGKDTNAPVADANSPKYYVSLKYQAEEKGVYSLFFYVTTKKN